MADKKITDLTELTEAASDDYLEIVDTSANASKKISLKNLTGGLATSTHNHDTAYLGITAKAADSDKLGGYDSTDFVLASGLGVWADWTPTIGYTGGSGTPTISAEGRYMIVGKIVYLLLTGQLTRNGATHAYFSISTPTSVAKFGSGSFTHQFGADSFTLSPVYKAGGTSTFSVSTGIWTKDGFYWFSGFYEMP